MSSGRNLQSEDQFLCSICLDVFTDPVSTPCGHNFCKTCITQLWDANVPCKCPLCKDHFTSRPQLRVNTLLREMVDQFRVEAQQEASRSSEQQAAKPGEIPCDVCTGPKLKALKSCMVCLLSYCQTHLEPHLTAPRLKKHQLMEPVENLEDRMCLQHDKPLELFCSPVLDHKNHEFVPLREESEGKKAELRKTDDEVQEMIQERRLKIQEIRESMKISRDAADREKAEGVQVFMALMESAERGLKELIKEIQDRQEATEKQAEDFIRDLEQEISELKKRSSEVKQLSQDEDPLHILQRLSFLKDAPHTKTWTEVRVHPPNYGGTVVRALAQLEENMKWIMAKLMEVEMKMMKKLMKTEMKRVQQFAVDVTLDPDTANPHLILSEDGKQVKHGNVMNNLPDNPERFSYCANVLGQQSFSSGRFYFEVQVKGKTDWDLGVATESINRKGEIALSPRNGFWTIWLRKGYQYKALAGPAVSLHLHPGPQKVGVFVDYEEGLVSFYDADAAALIFSFTGCYFKEKLYPFLSAGLNAGGTNAAPLIICPVQGDCCSDEDDEDESDQKIREMMMKELIEAEMKRIQQFAVDVTLDPDTAHNKLILSEDGKQVKHGNKGKNLPDFPERFSSCICVLGQRSFSSGRFYFEVQVKGKTDWDLGVARESINRKGEITLSLRKSFWTIALRNGYEYKALANPDVRLHLHPGPQKVGVFVDYEEGLVSFYDADAAALIFSFTGCCFKEKLYPYFGPRNNAGGTNSAPLIICPVNQADC